MRQIAHRARAHVAARRPREVASPAESHAAFEAFVRATETGDLQSLIDVLAPDVVALSDGGGVRQALRRPLIGADRVARMLVAGVGQYGASVEPTQLNGWPALLLRLDCQLDSVIAFQFAAGRVSGVYSVRRPRLF